MGGVALLARNPAPLPAQRKRCVVSLFFATLVMAVGGLEFGGGRQLEGARGEGAPFRLDKGKIQRKDRKGGGWSLAG